MNVLVPNGNSIDDGPSEQVEDLMVSQSTNTENIFIKVTLVIYCIHSIHCIVKVYLWWEIGDACQQDW